YDIIHQYGGWKKAHLAKETRDFEETKVVTTLNGLTPVAHGIKNCLSKRHRFKFPRDFFCVQKTCENIKSLVDKYIFYKANTHFMSHYDKLFSQSKWIKDIYIKAGIPSDKIKVIGNFYDPQFYQDLKDSDINKKEDEDSTNILYVGRFSENKGVLDLIKAFDIVRKKMNVKLFLIGGGAQQNYFEELIEEMGLKDKIVMPGHVPYNEIIKYYSKGDIFVHPAKYPTEALNRTLMEAALSKTAIISSDVGTTPEVVGEDGLIYESGNIEKLADKIEKLGEDSGLRKKLSNQIFEKIKNSYSPEKIISDYEKEYYRLIEH
ncbi:MAG: glycosyltransferase, partial [Promethearchaeia archaeon]